LDLRPTAEEEERNVREFVFRWRVGKALDEDEEPEEEEEAGVRRGTKASSGPREGVVADNTPDGAAERKVPL
jgi:hypothetical protein